MTVEPIDLKLLSAVAAGLPYPILNAAIAELTVLRATVAIQAGEIERREAVAKAAWGDQTDEHTPAISAAHPIRSHDHDRFQRALEMVSTRHGKYELVGLANWLLARAEAAESAKAAHAEVVVGLKYWADKVQSAQATIQFQAATIERLKTAMERIHGMTADSVAATLVGVHSIAAQALASLQDTPAHEGEK